MKSFPLHPVCNIFPPLGEAEINELAEDIKANGLLEPIVLYDDKILDGRNRQEACRRAGVPIRTVEWVDPGCGATAWVVARNLRRRHMDAGQRAIAANKALPFYAAEAAARKKATQFGSHIDGPSENGGTARPAQIPSADFGEINRSVPVAQGEAAQLAARDFGVGATYVREAGRLERERPEEYAAVERGDKTLAAALREMRGEQHSADQRAGRPPEDTIDSLLAQMQSAAVGLTQRIEQLGGVSALREFLSNPVPYQEIQEMREDTLEGWDLVEIVAEQVRQAF